MDVKRASGLLLGVALGDALGLPFEGLEAPVIRRDCVDRFRFCGTIGFVSDDTEQSALVAESLCREAELARCVARFRRAMGGWFARLPFGIGFATMRACTRILFGLKRTGVPSAGNGAAMRAGAIGAFFADDERSRREFGRAFASVTHTDPRAIDGALFVAEVAALAVRSSPEVDRDGLVERACAAVDDPSIRTAIELARETSRTEPSPEAAAQILGNTGFVVHTIGLATYCFVRFGHAPLAVIEAAIRGGGDTDSIAAIAGGWAGALHGEEALPLHLVARIHDGPFGPSHLRALARSLALGGPVPRWSWSAALLRNLALYPVVLAHGVSRLVPR